MRPSSEADEAKEKAAVQTQLEAPGQIALLAWTRKLPQFTPAGPATKKVMDEQAHIVVSGTSPLTPAQLGDVREAAKTERMSFSRSNNSINDTRTVIINLHPQDVALGEVRLEATRAPKKKTTHITVTSPSPSPTRISAIFARVTANGLRGAKSNNGVTFSA